MAIKPFIKWSGSKRSQAREIISYFPKEFDVYFEPFLGSGAVLGHLKPKKAVGADINKPLISLWKELQNNPKKIADDYRKKWNALQKNGHTYFYKVRAKFNKDQSPLDFLFLTRTCVNGLIRYNKNGEFNNSLHHTRKGIHPDQLEKIILEWSSTVIKHKFIDYDYKKTTRSANERDFIYLDPPYFNTGTRYFGTIGYQSFLEYLNDLNKRGVRFALSYDGKRGEQSYVVDIPKNLYKRHILIHSGNSTFNKVQNGKIEKVHESLYLNY
jgi:DNA adenine methylase